jgi:hypothetical protein
MTATWTANRTWVAGEVVTATLLNQYVRDNLDWLKGRPYVSQQDFDGTFYAATTAVFADTGAASALTTTGGRVMVVAFGACYGSNTADISLTIYEDGVNKGDATLGMTTDYTTNASSVPFCICYITPTAPTAAAHTWRLYAKGDDSSGNIAVTQVQMWAIEIGA